MSNLKIEKRWMVDFRWKERQIENWVPITRCTVYSVHRTPKRQITWEFILLLSNSWLLIIGHAVPSFELSSNQSDLSVISFLNLLFETWKWKKLFSTEYRASSSMRRITKITQRRQDERKKKEILEMKEIFQRINKFQKANKKWDISFEMIAWSSWWSTIGPLLSWIDEHWACIVQWSINHRTANSIEIIAFCGTNNWLFSVFELSDYGWVTKCKMENLNRIIIIDGNERWINGIVTVWPWCFLEFWF